MPGTIAKIPVEFNIYYPTAANNFYLKGAPSYTNQTVSSSSVTGITKGTDASLSGHTNINVSTNTSGTAGLTNRVEAQVFERTFTASSGYHYVTLNGKFFAVNILEGYPKDVNYLEQKRIDKEADNEDNYASRWRFEEEVTTRNSDQLATVIKLKGYYTPPDYRSKDAQDKDGTRIANQVGLATFDDFEKEKLRGVFITPMLQKSTATVSSTINRVSIKERIVNDGTSNIHLVGKQQKTVTVILHGTPSATCILKVVQNSDSKTHDFSTNTFTTAVTQAAITLDSNGRARKNFTIATGTASDIWKIYVSPTAGTSLASGVPKIGDELKLYRYADVSFTIAPVTTTSSTFDTMPSAANILTGVPAFSSYVTDVQQAAPSTSYNTIDKENQLGETLVAFTHTISKHASKTEVNITSEFGGASGADRTRTINTGSVVLQKGDFSESGARWYLKDIKVTEGATNAVITGYVAVQNVGKASIVATYNIDTFLTAA